MDKSLKMWYLLVFAMFAGYILGLGRKGLECFVVDVCLLVFIGAGMEGCFLGLCLFCSGSFLSLLVFGSFLGLTGLFCSRVVRLH